jgi:uncharacterized protein (TIGR02996 family)
MTPEDAFVADILEHQDDDGPRLIFADYLEDAGDADRAEFIRVQCRRAAGGADEVLLRRRAEGLLQAHWDDWVGPLGALVGESRQEPWLRGGYHPEALYKFRRGFVYVLDLPARRFLDHGAEILRLAPLRQVRLHGAGPLAAELAGCVHLGRLERIDFTDYFDAPVDAGAMKALAGSPHLGCLRGLGLYRNNIGDGGLAALAGAAWLPGVAVLELGENGLSAAGLRQLAGTALPFRPVRLALAANALGDEGAAALAASPVLARVTTLSLARCNIGPAGARALADSPHLGGLRRLELEGNPLQEEGAAALASARWMGRRVTLDLGGGYLSRLPW